MDTYYVVRMSPQGERKMVMSYRDPVRADKHADDLLESCPAGWSVYVTTNENLFRRTSATSTDNA